MFYPHSPIKANFCLKPRLRSLHRNGYLDVPHGASEEVSLPHLTIDGIISILGPTAKLEEGRSITSPLRGTEGLAFGHFVTNHLVTLCTGSETLAGCNILVSSSSGTGEMRIVHCWMQ